ncbi:MAG: thiol:disulfide interchange protein DsbA/DsbL [Orrella sp.]
MLKTVTKMLAIGVMAFSSAAFAQAPNQYVNVNPPQTTEPGKIEVLEFFSYGCPHCAVVEPMVAEWKKTLPSDVVLYAVPVAFNAGMKPLQELFYALEALGRSDLHSSVYNAIHQEKKRISKRDAILDWASSQGLDKSELAATMASFGVQSKVQRADQLAKGYAVQGTPTLAVDGRYLTSPSEAGGYQEMIDVAAELIKKSQ